MSRSKNRIDSALAELVRQDVYESTTDEEAAYLRSDEMVERFLAELQRTVQSVQAQLTSHQDGTQPRTEEWRGSAGYVFAKYCERLEEVRPLAADLRQRWRVGDTTALQNELGRLRGAIRAHRIASEASEIDPETHDVELWTTVASLPK